MSDTPDGFFTLFNEIAIIGQLSRTLLERELPDGLLTPHFSVLNHLARLGDGRTPLQIARAFQVPKTSMTHTLAGLQSRNLIEMRPNPEDGRSKTVWLTEAGRRLRAATISRVETRIAGMQPDLAREDLDALLPRLANLRRWLDDNRPA